MSARRTYNSGPEGLTFNRVMPIFALVMVDVLGLTVILPLLHLYAIRFGASPVEIGLVAATFPACQLVGVPLMGALSDRYGRKPLLLISQITTFISFIMLAGANSLALILLSRALDGLFGANLATAQAALSDITTDENRTQALGITGAAFGLGFIIGPLIAILTLEFSDNLAIPALTAAGYSFLSIWLTAFYFKETLPKAQRGAAAAKGLRRMRPMLIPRYIFNPRFNRLYLLLFAQQLIFYGFESLLGAFTLSRLGLLGQGNALIFVVVGFTLVMVQARYLGKWTKRYGEPRVVRRALALLGIGMLLVALTPAQPHPSYVRRVAEAELAQQRISSTEAILGRYPVQLPPDGGRGFGGLLWILAAVIPLSVGAALIRPSLNGLITKRAAKEDFGVVLGVSAAFISAADAVAPLLSGYIFQTYGVVAPYLLGGALMLALALLVSFKLSRQPRE
jgi:MFS transporter, DHA1 family, tetracycline resistance protein